MKKSKKDLIDMFINTIKDSFVSEYEKINESRESINLYFGELNFNYQYDYNTFCIEFSETCEKILHELSIENIISIDINQLVFESFSYMIRQKIFNSTKNEEDKQKLILLHELKKYLIDKEGTK